VADAALLKVGALLALVETGGGGGGGEEDALFLPKPNHHAAVNSKAPTITAQTTYVWTFIALYGGVVVVGSPKSPNNVLQ